MTNTIPNVPRQLLADLLGNDHDKRIMAVRHLLAMLANAPSPAGVDADHVEDVRAMVADPSPAGVDGLNTDRNAAFKACPKSGCDWGSFYLGWKARGEVEQTIIDGLRGEIDKLMTTFVRVADHLHIDCEKAKSAPGKPSDVFIAAIDRQAQRIGELEGLLRHAQKQVPTGSGLHMRIDAALSAVCAAAPNIATTSEHSSQPERDPCPMCIKGGICNTPTCGRLLAMPKAY